MSKIRPKDPVTLFVGVYQQSIVLTLENWNWKCFLSASILSFCSHSTSGTVLTSLTGQTGSRRQRLCLYFRSKYPFCCYSVAQSCPILCDPTDWSMPGFPDLHCLPECAQTMFTESLIQSNYLNVCCSLLLLPSIFPSIRVFSNESALHIRWPKYWSFSFSISPSFNLM